MERCLNCQTSLEDEDLVLPWEDGDNEYAYIKCPRCGYENTKYGYGEDD